MPENKRQFTIDTYFEVQADADLSKHMGSYEVTDELIQLTRINRDSYVLDVGCGVGLFGAYVAKQTGCRMMGVDIREPMIQRGIQRAQREKLEGQLQFRVADAIALPFQASEFDVVLCESVNAFIPDLKQAFSEYYRVLKQGGWLGVTESLWKQTPSAKLLDYIHNDMPIFSEVLTAEQWQACLENAGFVEIVARTHEVDVKNELFKQVKHIGVGGMLRIAMHSLGKAFADSKYRDFYKAAAKIPPEIYKDIGYGVFVGKKP
jgi:ubiquinone/menaquinone biosynthesis C-methylase UbiE